LAAKAIMPTVLGRLLHKEAQKEDSYVLSMAPNGLTIYSILIENSTTTAKHSEKLYAVAASNEKEPVIVLTSIARRTRVHRCRKQVE